MYICEHCGSTREELNYYKESVFNMYNEYMGSYDEVESCSCGGEYVDAVECEMCGDWIPQDGKYDGICENCYREHARDFDEVIEFAKKDDLIYELLTDYIFEKSEIEEVLLKVAKEALSVPSTREKIKAKLLQFVDDSVDGFIYFLKHDV